MFAPRLRENRVYELVKRKEAAQRGRQSIEEKGGGEREC